MIIITSSLKAPSGPPAHITGSKPKCTERKLITDEYNSLK